MQQTSLYIPKPCHEDWNKMTPTQQGKFCSSCSKQVIDFSLMSDNQILNIISNQSVKLCGRFDARQLERPLIETKIKKKKGWWMALTMPLLFLFDRSEAQQKITGDTIYNVTVPGKTVGKLVAEKIPVCKPSDTSIIVITGCAKRKREADMPIQKSTVTIKGKVVDEDNNPLAYASVIDKDTKHTTVTDSLGNFLLDISVEDTVTLAASYVGYVATEKQIQPGKNDPVIITLQTSKYISSGLIMVTGGISSYNSIKPIDKIKATVKKFFDKSAFSINPNPAFTGSTIHIKTEQAGKYQMLMVNNQSALIITEEINILPGKSTASITIPSNIAAGIYYLRLINEKTKKSYTGKLVIQ